MIGAASRLASLSWDGRVVLDVYRVPPSPLRRRAACLYLTRPDGYVGYRSEAVDAERLWAYLDRIFVTG